MDLLTGIATVGSYMNNKEVETSKSEPTNRIKRTPLNAENAYTSKNYRKNKYTVDKLTCEQFAKARKPMETGIIPNYYNQIKSVEARKNAVRDEVRRRSEAKVRRRMAKIGDVDSVFSDDETVISRGGGPDLNDPMAFYKETIEFGKGLTEQFGDMRFDHKGDPRSAPKKGEYSSTKGDMTYNVNNGDMSHNNMMPSFKSADYGLKLEEQQQADNQKQRKMELFTGSINNVEYRPRTERKPLFNPQVGMTWIYGTPNFTDYFETRYIPGRERRNEMLHQPVRITPGLNLGYNDISHQGFNSEFRPMPKNVDQLRTANNPKIEYGRPIIPGKKGERRAVISKPTKNKPPRVKEMDPKDMLKSLGYLRAPTVHGKFDAPATNRQQTSTSWVGPVEATKKGEVIESKYNVPNRQSFLSDGPRNVTGIERTKNTTATANTYHVSGTNRMTTSGLNWVGGAGPEFKKGTTHNPNDVPDATMRNLTEKLNWIYGAGTEYKKGIAYNPNDIPNTTLRNTTENRSWINGAGPEYKKGMAYNPADIPDPTIRNTTEKFNWVNGPGTEYKKGMAYNPNDVPDPTLRNLIDKISWLNPAGTEWKKEMTVNFDDIPDPTLRNINGKRTWINGAGTEWKMGQAYNMKDVPDATLRNTTEKKTWINGASPEWKMGQTYTNDVPDATLRNTTERKTWINAASPEWKIAQTYINDTPEATLRNTTENMTWINGASPEWKMGQAYNMNDIPEATLRNTTENNVWINGISPEWKMGQAYINDAPNSTLRNTTEKNSWINGAGTQWHKGQAYINDTPNSTLRNTTENTAWINGAGTQWHKGQAYINDSPDSTLRNTTENTTWINGAGTQWHKGQAYINDAPDSTLRNTTENNRWINGAKTGWNKGTAFNVNDIPDPTLRNLIEKNTYVNPIGGENQRGAYQVAAQTTIAPTTLRQLTQHKTILGPMTPVDNERGGYQVAVQTTVAPTTLRQLIQNKTYQGPAILHEGTKQRGRNDANNSQVNIAKDQSTIIRDNGAPTTSNYEKGPTYEYTMFEACEPIQIDRDLYGHAYGLGSLGCVPTMYTRAVEPIPEENLRFDTCVTDSLKTNPFINNLIHKSPVAV